MGFNLKNVYVAFSSDSFSHLHLAVFEKARSLGVLTVGVLSDEALSARKRARFRPYEERAAMIRNVVGVETVVKQESNDYSENLRVLKPDYVVHGSDWLLHEDRRVIRDNVLRVLQEWGGELVEVPHTPNDAPGPQDYIREGGSITADKRARLFGEKLAGGMKLRLIDGFSPLSAMIAEKATCDCEGIVKRYDGIWAGSLTDAVNRGLPDTEIVSFGDRISSLMEILVASNLPVVFDGDTGGMNHQFEHRVKVLECLGVSAVVIEDKVGLKRNSLFGSSVEQTMATVDEFCEKIRVGKRAQSGEDFMIIARLESLISGEGMGAALRRSKEYVAAGADAIMIHSKDESPDDVLSFCRQFREYHRLVPILAVPSSYNSVYENELFDSGVNIVAYANQMQRASVPAMINAANSILRNGRSKELDDELLSISEILSFIPGN